MTKITLNKATCHLLEEGVILVTYKNNVEIDINEVIEIRNTTHQLANGKAFVAIYDAGEDTLITKEAREISAKDGNITNRKAMAIIVKHLGQRIIANFFINLNKKIHPMKAFTNREDAVKWAKQFLDK
ncbi:MAG: hypothetical protein KFKLKKLM_00781 [Flavobacteriales bacterium]|nr:hypothetical protein [Flavobacteriales bacterium]